MAVKKKARKKTYEYKRSLRRQAIDKQIEETFKGIAPNKGSTGESREDAIDKSKCYECGTKLYTPGRPNIRHYHAKGVDGPPYTINVCCACRGCPDAPRKKGRKEG